MLLLFWLPILFCESYPQGQQNKMLIVMQTVSMLWAFHNGVRFALQAIKTVLPAKAGLRT